MPNVFRRIFINQNEQPIIIITLTWPLLCKCAACVNMFEHDIIDITQKKRICPCVRRTWVVPSTHRRRATEVQTRTPRPVARRTHVEGTAKARRQYVERALAVGFSACDSVRRRHGGRKRRALPVRWLQNHFQTPISRRRRRIWDVTPPQHQTRKSRSTYGGLWPRHNDVMTPGARPSVGTV